MPLKWWSPWASLSARAWDMNLQAWTHRTSETTATWSLAQAVAAERARVRGVRQKVTPLADRGRWLVADL